MTNDSKRQEPARLPSGRYCVGQRLACSTCGNAVVVLDLRDVDTSLVCCGSHMHPAAPLRCGAGAGHPREQLGMRAGQLYSDHNSDVLLRCIRAGSGKITSDGRTLLRSLHS